MRCLELGCLVMASARSNLSTSPRAEACDMGRLWNTWLLASEISLSHRHTLCDADAELHTLILLNFVRLTCPRGMRKPSSQAHALFVHDHRALVPVHRESLRHSQHWNRQTLRRSGILGYASILAVCIRCRDQNRDLWLSYLASAMSVE